MEDFDCIVKVHTAVDRSRGKSLQVRNGADKTMWRLKMYPKRDGFQESLEHLRTKLNSNHCEMIADIFEHRKSDGDGTCQPMICVLSKFEMNGSLEDELNRYRNDKQQVPEDRVQVILANLLANLTYLQSNDVFHGNLKPSNIILKSSSQMVLGDMLVGNHKLCINCQDAYSCPDNDPCYQDLWSLGCVLIALMTCSLYRNQKLLEILVGLKTSTQLKTSLMKELCSQYSYPLVNIVSDLVTIIREERGCTLTGLCHKNPYINSCFLLIKSPMYKDSRKGIDDEKVCVDWFLTEQLRMKLLAPALEKLREMNIKNDDFSDSFYDEPLIIKFMELLDSFSGNKSILEKMFEVLKLQSRSKQSLLIMLKHGLDKHYDVLFQLSEDKEPYYNFITNINIVKKLENL